MKLKLIYDSDAYCGVGDDICMEEDDDPGYCSDQYVNSRHDHERTDYRELLHRQMNKYCRSKARTQDMHLVDVPDEIMLQYMLEGVYDLDWIAFNLKDYRISISNTAWGALRYGEERRYGRGGSVSANGGVPNQRFFEFNISATSAYDAQNSAREDYMLVPDGEHYKNIKEALEPYVQFRLAQHFSTCSDMIRSTQDFGKSDCRYGGYEIEEDGLWYEDQTLDTMLSMKRVFQPDEHKCRDSWDIRYDTFLMCMEFWREDHPSFLAIRQYLSDYEIESFRLLDERIKRKVSGTN